MGDDFTLLMPGVTLGEDQGTTQCVVVGIISDQTTEGTEQFQLKLHLNESNLQEMGLVTLTPDTATISIIDDDRKNDKFSYSAVQRETSVGFSFDMLQPSSIL